MSKSPLTFVIRWNALCLFVPGTFSAILRRRPTGRCCSEVGHGEASPRALVPGWLPAMKPNIVSLKDGDTCIAWQNRGVTLKHISFQSNKVQCTVLYLKFLTMKTSRENKRLFLSMFKSFFSFFDFCLVYVFNDSEACYKRRSGPTGYSECARVCWSCGRFQNRCHCTFTAQGTWNKCISLLPVLAVKSFNPRVE